MGFGKDFSWKFPTFYKQVMEELLKYPESSIDGMVEQRCG